MENRKLGLKGDFSLRKAVRDTLFVMNKDGSGPIDIPRRHLPAVCYIWKFVCGCFYIGKTISFFDRVAKTFRYAQRGIYNSHCTAELAAHIRTFPEVMPDVLKRFATEREVMKYESKQIQSQTDDEARRMTNRQGRSKWHPPYERCSGIDWNILNASPDEIKEAWGGRTKPYNLEKTQAWSRREETSNDASPQTAQKGAR